MKKKKTLVMVCACVCLVLIVAAMVFIFQNKEEQNHQEGITKVTLEQVKEAYQSDIEKLKSGKYSNLVYHEFEGSLAAVEGVYNIEIQRDRSYENRTFLENCAIMKEVIDKFFMEDFDKSYIVADFNIEGEETIYVSYDDIEKICVDEKYNNRNTYLFGNNTSEGGYMVQIGEGLFNTWFSKYGLGDIHPSEYVKVYSYISGICQNDDVVLKLKDGDIPLADMETRVLSYIEKDFPLPYSDAISYGIGDVRILQNGEYEGVAFKLRRIYKGIPFEYGSAGSSGEYVDKLGHDFGELTYAESTAPDTLTGFGHVNGTVVETQTISELFTAGDALNLLSQKIGENSTYDVYGMELVYREGEIPEERKLELDDILAPKWKIITINQNDDKYTLFYVDVVTGEITERFEYYYE